MGLLPDADQPDYKVFDSITNYRITPERLLVADPRSLGNDFQRRLLRKLTPIKHLRTSGFDPFETLAGSYQSL
jgi:hypothetical protein